MKTANETQNLKQTFQDRLNEANQAVAEAEPTASEPLTGVPAYEHCYLIASDFNRN